MDRIKKKICMLSAVFFILSVFVVPVHANEEKTSVRNRKLVSVVYDDSTSMCNERWEYTSYAMQCFAAMLNKEDALDITYMSSYTRGSFSVDTDNRNASVKSIREHTQMGGTPIDAIDTAFETLRKNNDKNVNTQYWLIVITDGQMSGEGTVEDKINKIAETKMPNDTKPQIVFMTIGDVNKMFTPTFSKSNIRCEPVLTADAVVDTISDIACDISGRYAVSEEDITFVDNQTVKVRTDVPLIHLGVLSQRSDAIVSKVSGSKGNLLQIECNVHVELPGMFPDFMSKDDINALRGNVSLFNAETGNIAPDIYTITFNDKISKEDLVIMFEPAFELRLEVFDDDTVIDDLSKLVSKQVVDIKATLYEIGTNNKILPSMLPSGVIEQISLSEGGKETIREQDLLLEDVELKSVETVVNASVETPGFFTVKDTIRFTANSIKISDIKASVHYDGSPRIINDDGSTDAENVVYITSLDTNETGVKFTLYIDGKPIDKAYATAIKDLFAQSLNLEFENYKIFVCDDGGIVVSPTATKMPALIYWFLHQGDTVIETRYDGITASEVICFKIGDMEKAIIEFVLILILIIGLIYVVYWMFGKPHFHRADIKMFVANREYGTYLQDYGKTRGLNWLSASGLFNFIGPFGMKKKVGNFSVRSVKGGYELLGVKGRYVSTSITYPSANTGITECKKNTCRFSSSVYVYDNTRYYKIMISK